MVYARFCALLNCGSEPFTNLAPPWAASLALVAKRALYTDVPSEALGCTN